MAIKRSDKITNRTWRLLNTERNLARWEHVLSLPYGETLEVGPGVGLFTVKLYQRGVETPVLLENNPNFVAVSLDMLKVNNIYDVLVLPGDINRAPFIDRCFDTIVCLEVLEHIKTPNKALEEMARVCRKGGDLYLTVPGEGLLPPSKCKGHHQDFNTTDLFQLIEAAGWSVYKQFNDEHYQYFYSKRTR